MISSKMYDEETDLLNCYDVSGKSGRDIDEYAAYIQNTDAGVYIIIAKSIRIER